MTLCIGWVRKVGNTNEICVVADSCLTGGQKFLAAPKIFPLPRRDCVIACAGPTLYSFPIVEHIVRAIELNQKLRERASDVTDVVHLIEDISNKCLHEEQEPEFAMQGDGPGFSMMIAGYSWRKKSYLLKTLTFDWKLRKMKAAKSSTIKKIPFSVIGDNVGMVRGRIHKYLDDHHIDASNINLEPLEILMQCIEDRSTEFRAIDGHPQMVKIYPYPNVLPIVFLHTPKDVEGRKVGDSYITYFGRPLLSFETFPYPIYDLDKKTFRYMYKRDDSDEFKRYHEDINPLSGFEKNHKQY